MLSNEPKMNIVGCPLSPKEGAQKRSVLVAETRSRCFSLYT